MRRRDILLYASVLCGLLAGRGALAQAATAVGFVIHGNPDDFHTLNRNQSRFGNSGSSEPPEHLGGGGEGDPACGHVGPPLVIAREAAVVPERAEGALDHPSPFLDRQALCA